MFENWMKEKFVYVILRKEFEGYRIVKSIVKKQPLSELKIQQKSYILSLKQPSYINKLKNFYFIDYDLGSQIVFQQTNALIRPEELDTIVGNKLITEITKGLMQNTKEKIFWILMGAIIGALCSAVLMLFYMQSKIDEIYAGLSATTIVGM